MPQGYNDNSGLAPILNNFLHDKSAHGQILVLILNKLGDHQMETYFAGGGGGGMICEGDMMGPHLDDEFQRMDDRYRASFEAVGGKYIKQPHEKGKTCAVRLAKQTFFEVCGRSRHVIGMQR